MRRGEGRGEHRKDVKDERKKKSGGSQGREVKDVKVHIDDEREGRGEQRKDERKKESEGSGGKEVKNVKVYIDEKRRGKDGTEEGRKGEKKWRK